MTELVNKQIGKEGKLDLGFKEGKLELTLGLDSAGVDAGLFVTVEPDYFLDKLKAAIPGTVDDTIIDLLKVAFKTQA